MSKGFWNKLKKPFFVLAPMADVTDPAFRIIIAKYGKPDVMWTEFVSADGLFSSAKNILMRDLEFDESERPIVAQFFSPKKDLMKKAAELAVELGFDGIDINMGCPDKNIVKQGSGSAMIKKPKEAREIIRATIEGAGDLPVSVKTRIGFNQNEIETWLPEILAENPAVVILHARTKKDMSKVPAKWDVIKRAVEIRDELESETLIIGNGDIKNLKEGRKRVHETGCDGVMIGRGIFGNPWFFSEYEPTIEEKVAVLVEHTKLFEEMMLDRKSFAVMKKHFKAYINGFDGAKDLRVELMEKVQNSEDLIKILKNHGFKIA